MTDDPLYPEELLTDILEMSGLTEGEMIAAMDQDPALFRIMSLALTGETGDQRPDLLKRVKAAIAYKIGLCIVCDHPAEPVGDGVACLRCRQAHVVSGLPKTGELIGA